MQSRAASVAAMSASSAESAISVSISSSRSEDTLSELQSDDAASSSRKVKPKKNYTQVPGTFSRATSITPSAMDADTNAIFQANIDERDGQRVFKCLECEKTFSTPYNARRHAKVHLKGQKVTCAICSERLSGPKSLAIHHKENHKGQKMVKLSTKKDMKGSSLPENTRKSSRSTAEIPSKKSSSEYIIAHDSAPEKTKTNRPDKSSIRVSTRSKTREDMVEALKEECEKITKRKNSDDIMLEEVKKEGCDNTVKRKKSDDGVSKTVSKTSKTSDDTVEMANEKAPEETIKAKQSDDTVMKTSMNDTDEESVLEVERKEGLEETIKSKKIEDSVMKPSDCRINDDITIEVTNNEGSEEDIKAEYSDDVVTNSSQIDTSEESVIEVARKQYCEMSLRGKKSGEIAMKSKTSNGKMREGTEDCDEVVVILPDTGEKMQKSKPPITQERRSTRIQMRLAMEASAVDEEKYGLRSRKVTPPRYPSNNEKMKDLQMELRAKSRREPSTPPLAMNEQSSLKEQPALEQELLDILAEVGAPTPKRPSSKRCSRSNSNSARASSSRESIVTVYDYLKNTRGPARPATPCIDLTSDGSGATASNSVHHMTAPPAAPRKPSTITPVTVSPQIVYHYGLGATASYRNGPGSNHYPRLGGLYGQRVHHHQPTITVNRGYLYPAPLTLTLLQTIKHPFWLNPKAIGLDEIQAMSLYGHSHLILPMRIRSAGFSMERCLKGLQETALPLPPLQPLLPSPCPLLDDPYSDPLADVLDSRPPTIPSHPHPFAPLRVLTVPQMTYTTASEGVRAQVWMKSEERKWWEVRTFPSFHALNSSVPSCPLLTTSARLEGTVMTYSMADKNTRIHPTKYTYVTSKKPIFSVLEPPLVHHPPFCTAVSSSHNPATSYTPWVIPATSGGFCIEQGQSSRPATPRRQPLHPPSAIAAATRALSLSAPPKKRKTLEDPPPSQIAAMLKRIKTSYQESSAGKSNQTSPPELHALQPMMPMQPIQQMLQPTEDTYPTAAQSELHCVDQEQLKQEKIAVEQNGTTFTVL